MDLSADVELRNVRKEFRGVTAVDGISLAIEPGEFFALLGPSGCGKTTTLRMIAGFEHPTNGEVLIQGQSMGDTPSFARNVNTVFQQYALFPHMNVADNVGFGLRMKRVSRSEIERRVAEALALVRLTGFGDRRPRQLSGGQQQRVALARALINRPAVLLLDEPLGALDLKLRKEMQIELKRLQSAVGITFIYVTHDQEEALTMSDRIAVMNAGRVLQVGTPRDIYERPANRFVAGFIGESNFLEGVVREIGEQRLMVDVEGMTLPIELSDGKAPPPVGERCTVALRPERVRLQPAKAPPSDVTLLGRVEDLVYVGTDVYVSVRISDRTTIRARRQNDGDPRLDLAQPVAGDDVAVTWTTNSARLLTS